MIVSGPHIYIVSLLLACDIDLFISSDHLTLGGSLLIWCPQVARFVIVESHNRDI